MVIPQLEHARLSGAIAAVWGNDAFALPALPRERFVEGVVVHDRGYPPFDNAGINEVPEEEWLAIQRRGAELRCGDDIIDLLVAYHLCRLLSFRKTRERMQLRREIELQITELLARTALPARIFEHADTIMGFCDSLSFDFCFELPKRQAVSVRPREHAPETEVTYRILPRGEVTITPWPLSVGELRGTILGYASEGYSEKRVEVAIDYYIRPE